MSANDSDIASGGIANSDSLPRLVRWHPASWPAQTEAGRQFYAGSREVGSYRRTNASAQNQGGDPRRKQSRRDAATIAKSDDGRSRSLSPNVKAQGAEALQKGNYAK